MLRAPVRAVVPPGVRDRVDPAEHAVADVGPPHLVDRRVDPEVAGPGDGARDVGGVHEHLGRDAADVEAGAAERAVLDQRDVEVLEAGVEERVARAGADDDQVVVAHPHEVMRSRRHGRRVRGWRQRTCDMMSAVHRAAGPDLSPAELYGLLRLRVDVFVVEQRCAYAELDGRDLDPGHRAPVDGRRRAVGVPAAADRARRRPPDRAGLHRARGARAGTGPAPDGGGARRDR